MINWIIIIGLLVASIWDIRKLQIPLWVTIPLFISVLISRFHVEYLLGMIPGIVLIAVSIMTRGQIGMADAFLVICIGLAVGAYRVMGILFLALLLAGIWSGILIVFLRAGKKKVIPFAPFLLAAYGGVFFAI